MAISQQRALRRAMMVGLVAGAVALGTVPAAMAAPGDWTQLSAFPAATAKPRMSIIDQPTVARFGSALSVIWNGEGDGGSNYYTAIVDGAGRVTTPSREIISNWAGVTENPALISLNGQRFLTFGGLQSTNTGAPYTSGAEYYATSADGVTYTLGAGSLSATTTAYAAYGSDALDNAGTPVWIGNAGTTTGISWHVGISPTDPAPAGSDGHFALSGCCAYMAAGARDPATGAVYGAFYSNSSGTAEMGVQVGQILPTQGAFTQAPGSVTTNDYGTNSTSPSQRVALVGRPGGGVYAAYAMGYPSVTTIRIWQVGTANTLDVPAPQSSDMSLAADPSGRLWLTYAQGDRVKVVHTNKAATKLGAIGSWGIPRGSTDLWKTASSATDGTLDVVVTASDKNEKVNVFHTQVLRTLSVKADPASTRRGADVTFVVTDAGDPVPGVQVKFGGRSASTNASGKATIAAPGSRGRVAATAKKSGYNNGQTSVRVR
jgi:hypothetical protein